MTAETEVRAVLGRLTDAWNAGDATAYARLFTEDADYVTFFGMNFPGREAIESSHRALFEGPLKGVKLTGQPVTFHTYPTDHSGTMNASLKDSIPFAAKLMR